MKKILGVVMVGFMALGLAACGGGGGSTTSTLSSSLDSLTEIPSTSEMFRANTSVSSISAKGLKAVSGTAPLLTSLSTSNADTYFWNGLIATIIANNTATAAQRAQFWGETDGGPGAELACRMAQTTGYTMEQIIRSGTSLCYMKGMPAAVGTANVTDNSGLGVTPSNIFDRAAANKIIKVTTSGQSGDMGGDQDIFLTVYGSDTIGTSAYKVLIYMCSDGASEANQYNIITANLSDSAATIDGESLAANTMKITDAGNMSFGGQSQVMSSEVTGKLRVSSGSIEFDPTASRSATFEFNQNSGQFVMKSIIEVSAENQITTKEYSVQSSENSFENKMYSLIGFSGSGMSDLRFEQAGTKGAGTSGEFEFSFGGGVEFQDTYYVATSSSDYATTADAFVFANDSFYTSAPTGPTVDASSYDCSATPDVEVAMDMTDAAVAAVATSCEGAMLSNMNFCDSTTVMQARNIIFASE